MCYPEKCPQCNKTGWAGCGQHIDDVMQSVPAANRCTCLRTGPAICHVPEKENEHVTSNIGHTARTI
jgi:hypothetical protein